MATPRRHSDPDGDKRRALKHAAVTVNRLDKAEQARTAAIRFAADCGASLREIADATGIPHMTVKRILERAKTMD